MIALRLVFDTNVIVSAALNKSGPQYTALVIAVTRPASLFVTREILTEYKEVLARRKFGFSKGQQSQLLQLIKSRSRLGRSAGSLNVCSDPDDDKFVECADVARADYLVTGNLRDFPKYWRGTKIISPRAFLEIVGLHLQH